jgi:hypothetical protein
LVVERTKDAWIIPAMIPEFVPSGSCIVALRDLDDPVLEKICDNTRAIRRKYFARQAAQTKGAPQKKG